MNTKSPLEIKQELNVSQHHRNVEVFRQERENKHSVLNMGNDILETRNYPNIVNVDRDDNKYKKKTLQEIFSRWSRQFYSPASRPPWKRKYFIVISAFIMFFMLIYVMYHFGRSGDDEMNSIHYDE